MVTIRRTGSRKEQALEIDDEVYHQRELINTGGRGTLRSEVLERAF